MVTEVSKRLFNADEYHRMVDAGILTEDDRVELIEGEILAMSPIGSRHNGTILRATQALSRIAGDRALVGVQGSVRLDFYNEPQPDLYLLRPRTDFYTAAHAGPADIFLIIEVAESSLDYDQQVKRRLYANKDVPEYWIADLVHDRLLAYGEPRQGDYAVFRMLARGEQLFPRLLPDCRIPVDSLLP